MHKFEYSQKIRFTKAVYYNFRPIPLPKPFKDGTGGFGNFCPEQGYLELHDDTGMTAHYTVSRSFIKEMLPKILNQKSLSYSEWIDTLYWQIRNAGFQSEKAVHVGTLDFMMLDILAQRAGEPLHRFLGATKDWAAAYKGGGSILQTDEELVEEMSRYVSEGFQTVKFKVCSPGEDGMYRDVKRVEKVRKALGDKIGIAVDANQGWSVGKTVEFDRLTGDYKLEWIEEPIHSHDNNGIKKIIENGVETRLAFGESMRIYYAYETYAEKGVKILQPSLGRMSKIGDLIKIRDLARDYGIEFQSGGRTAYNASMGCLYGENERIEFHAPISEPVHEFMSGVPQITGGRCYVRTDISGIPVRMDVEKIEKQGYLESKTIYLAE